ncbi:MAG TPA: AAA family ATPase [Ramlibacter sp.]|nr:AAA family ATPase [Ramlibacter sp.]
MSTIECPDLLRSLPAWICWKYEHVPGEAKPRKVPYYTGGARRRGVQGRPEDRQQLTTFDAARSAAARRGMDGVGFCPMPDFGIVALDFDHCITAAGLLADVERAVAGTYAEFSPSGQGVRAFMRGDLGNGKAHGEPYGFEVFSSKGFVTFTGRPLPVTDLTDAANTVAEVTPDVLALCTARFGRVETSSEAVSTSATEPLGLTPEQLQGALDVLPLDLDYDAWLRVGMALHHETGGSEEGFQLWDDKFSESGKYSSQEYGRFKWDSFGRGNQRPTTVHALVKMANEHGAHIDVAAAAAADFDVIATPAAPEAPAKPTRFLPVQAGAFASGKSPGWLVKNVVPAADLIVLFGESGSGKSFMALDIAGAVARGVEWRGNRVKQGRVVVIAAEGGAGFRNRLKAYSAKHEIDLADLDIWVIHAAPNMLLKDDALDVCKAILAIGGADLVIIDTFAQVTPGANENAAEDMGKALAHCRGIRVAVKAPVMLVHHSGKDASRGARGWSGLKAAADAELEVVRMPTGRVIRVSKQKDGEDGLAWGFDLDVVPVGADEDGDIITSCVVRETDMPVIQQVAAALKGMGKLQRKVLEVVNEMAEAQTDGIEVSAIVEEVVRRTGKAGERNAKSHARRALNELCERDDVVYSIEDGVLSIT